MDTAKQWEFPNQFHQEGAISSPPLRAQLLLRNYQLCAKSSLLELLEPLMRQRLIMYVEKAPVIEEGLISFEELRKKQSIKIFTYGSLLNSVSASFDLKGSGRPMLSFGIKRIFNYQEAQLAKNRLGLPSPENALETARLNVMLTDDVSDFLPGAVYEVDEEDLLRLEMREKGYMWKKIHVMDFDEVVHGILPEMEEVYVLMLPVQKKRQESLPHQSYLNVCLEGARQFGKRFLKLFANTTYLADGETTILEWLRNEVIHMNLEMIPTAH